MKKGDIQQQISDEQCTAIHNYSKFSFGFGNTRVVPKKKVTKYGMYAVYTVLWACMHMHKDKHNNRLVKNSTCITHLNIMYFIFFR